MDQTKYQEPLPRRRMKPPDNVHHHPPPPPQKCPRCDSSTTKFCYYNNYSISQPRYFCKGCRRYWTHGGTLRNVPIGGGCRKNKRPKFSGPSTSTNQIVTRSQPISVACMDQGLCSSSNMDTNNNNNTNSLYTGGAILSTLASMQAINLPSVGGNVALLHGTNISSLRSFQSAQQLGNGVFQLPMTSWAQGFVDRGGAAGSTGGGAGLWGGRYQVGSSFNPNKWSSNNHQGFHPSR